MTLPALDTLRIAVIGLGYVGLPLAVYFGQKFPVIGFDIDSRRIGELRHGLDRTREVSAEELTAASLLDYTSDPDVLASCNFFVVTVPTPIDAAKRPDLTALEKASETVGRALAPGAVVVYESTVFPGATEEVCVPILERTSGFVFNTDFFVGYSPERINPGDHEHRLPTITKITAGSTPEVADLVDQVYASIITAGTYKVSSIMVAEAAKVIENIQRDVNIALVNELALLFKRMGVESREVFDAAGTKWNFHNYRPGLVGGHCIGVDPYYLTHKANMLGFHPEVILSGRRTNDDMAQFLAHDVVSVMLKRNMAVGSARILVMGFAFKENCPDTRNTKVAELVEELTSFVRQIVIFDPFVDADDAREAYGYEVATAWPEGPFDGIVLAVRHSAFVEAGVERLKAMLTPSTGFIYDVKGAFSIAASDARL